MPLVTGVEALQQAEADGYALGAFNFSSLEVLQAIVRAATEEQTPVFIATTEGSIRYAGLSYLVALARTAAAETRIPLVLHLDHGQDFDLIAECIRNGYTSVMIDASQLPFEENLQITKRVTVMAHAYGVSVEAELGRLKGIEDTVSVTERDAVLVDPEQAARFVFETGIDYLAPAIGTAHGAFKFTGEPKLDFDRLKRVRALTGIPLVLHGASQVPQEVIARANRYGAKISGAKGVPLKDIQQAIRLGIRKVNVDTDLRLLMIASLRQTLAEQPEEVDLRRIFGPARAQLTELVRQRMKELRLKSTVVGFSRS